MDDRVMKMSKRRNCKRKGRNYRFEKGRKRRYCRKMKGERNVCVGRGIEEHGELENSRRWRHH